jgi:PHP family Zn ribbon phosphoesterase
LAAFGSEMAVLHRADYQDLANVVGEKTAAAILAARSGEARIVAGAGGIYGRMLKM